MNNVTPPGLFLFLVSSEAITPGEVTIVRDDRVEHLLGDDSHETQLGTVTIS